MSESVIIILEYSPNILVNFVNKNSIQMKLESDMKKLIIHSKWLKYLKIIMKMPLQIQRYKMMTIVYRKIMIIMPIIVYFWIKRFVKTRIISPLICFQIFFKGEKVQQIIEMTFFFLYELIYKYIYLRKLVRFFIIKYEYFKYIISYHMQIFNINHFYSYNKKIPLYLF